MNTLIMYALKTIRYRSLIAEALLGNLSKCEDTKRRSEIITVCHRSADVIEHISQYAIEDCLDKHQLIQDLEWEQNIRSLQRYYHRMPNNIFFHLLVY